MYDIVPNKIQIYDPNNLQNLTGKNNLVNKFVPLMQTRLVICTDTWSLYWKKSNSTKIKYFFL